MCKGWFANPKGGVSPTPSQRRGSTVTFAAPTAIKNGIAGYGKEATLRCQKRIVGWWVLPDPAFEQAAVSAIFGAELPAASLSHISRRETRNL